jgi:hypothetical protein
MNIKDLKEWSPPPLLIDSTTKPYELDKSLVWESAGVFYRYDSDKGWTPVTPQTATNDLLTDIAKKLEKTNTLLARIESAVQCCEDAMQAINKNTR